MSDKPYETFAARHEARIKRVTAWATGEAPPPKPPRETDFMHVSRKEKQPRRPATPQAIV